MFDFEHLRKNNFTYFQHFRRASRAALLMAYGAISGLIHSILPFIFCESMTEVSKEIVSMHNDSEKK